MYAFRYNPVFDKWVLVGPPVLAIDKISKAHLIPFHGSKNFLSANFPRAVLDLDLPTVSQFQVKHNDLLHIDHPAIGEYELLLYRGQEDFWLWENKNWESWLALLQDRIRQSYLNLKVKHCHFEFRTRLLYSPEAYLRIGDLLTTSHPIYGSENELDDDLLQKLKKEELFAVYKGDSGWVYIPSAPLHNKELWYLPYEAKGGLERAEKKDGAELCKVVRHFLQKMHNEWPNEHYVLKIHTSIKSKDSSLSWWAQIYKDEEQDPSNILPVINSPEGFVYILHKMLGRI